MTLLLYRVVAQSTQTNGGSHARDTRHQHAGLTMAIIAVAIVAVIALREFGNKR